MKSKGQQSLEGEVLDGKQFNEIFCDWSLVKLTNSTEVHNNFQFKDGLNNDTITFYPKGRCKEGGIYFIEKKNQHKWIHYSNKIGFMMYVRKVIIPDDAKVYIENDKYKADKIILGPRKLINDNVYIKSIKNDINIFTKYMPNTSKNKEIC